MLNPSKADPLPEVDEQGPRRNLLREAWLGFAACSRWIPIGRQPASEQKYTRALVFLPIAGLVSGIALALVDHALAPVAQLLARSALILALANLLSGGLFPIGFGNTLRTLTGESADEDRSQARAAAILGVASSAILIAEIFVLGAIGSSPARARALVLGMMLSRWSIVPIGYGLRPLEQPGLGIPYAGGLRFSEFAVSSLIALGLAMVLYDVVGLAAIVAVALMILGLRLLFSRRLGGAGGYELAAGAAVCEWATLAVVAAISAL